MLINPTNVYGDIKQVTKVIAGRPTYRFAVGDSVINGWYPNFASQMPGLVGYGDILCLHPIGPPASPGAHVSGFWSYGYRATTGQAVIRGAHSIGATSINIYNLVNGFLPAGNAFPMAGMTLTIDTAGQLETGRISNSYTGTGLLLPTTGADSNSILLAAATTKTHADGTIVSWTRPSTERAYTMKTVSEVLFATAASPQDATWIAGRLAIFDTIGNRTDYVDNDESYYLHDAVGINSGAVNIIHFYLALPVNGPAGGNALAPNLRLHGRTAEVSPVESTVDFSIYAATPTIKAVTLSMAAPAAYDATKGIRCSVNSPNTGNFVAGMCYVSLGFFVIKQSQTSGVILDAGAAGGMQLQDLANDAASFGNIWSAAYQAQYAAAVRTTQLGNIDIYTIHLGMNNCPTTTAATVALINTIDANMAAAEPVAGLEFCTPYSTATLVSSGSAARLSAACPLTAVGNNCSFDMIAECGGSTYVTTRYLADGTHPIDPSGKEWFAQQYHKMIKACQAVVLTNRMNVGRGIHS